MDAAYAQALTLKAHAKVNLCLSVQYPPHDGYHQLDSVFQELDLCDMIHVAVLEAEDDGVMRTSLGTSVVLDCAVQNLLPQDNLIFHALDLAERTFEKPILDSDDVLDIKVEKHIPAGGGLGGGSSDAAAMLKAYARMTGVDPQDGRMIALARHLGADVAFFLQGRAALMLGRGDVFEQSLPSLQMPIVLMGDHIGMSTAEVYRAFDENPSPAPDSRALARAMQAAPENSENIARYCSNNLERAACAQSARLATRLSAARDHECALNALVAGSGATCFALCADLDSARRFARDIDPLCDWVRICRAI